MRTRPTILAAAFLVLSCCDAPAPPAPPTPPRAPAARVDAPDTPATAAPAVEAPAAPTPVSRRDPCLVGTWRLTEANALAYYRALMARFGAPMVVESVEGSSTIVFGEAGDARSSLDDLRIHYTMRAAGGPPMSAVMRLAASGTGAWTAAGGHASVEGRGQFEMNGSMDMTMPGGRTMHVPLDPTTSRSFGDAFTGAFEYTCSPTTLVASYAAMPAVPITWVR